METLSQKKKIELKLNRLEVKTAAFGIKNSQQ